MSTSLPHPDAVLIADVASPFGHIRTYVHLEALCTHSSPDSSSETGPTATVTGPSAPGGSPAPGLSSTLSSTSTPQNTPERTLR